MIIKLSNINNKEKVNSYNKNDEKKYDKNEEICRKIVIDKQFL